MDGTTLYWLIFVTYEMRKYVHTSIHTFIHTHVHTYIRTYIH